MSRLDDIGDLSALLARAVRDGVVSMDQAATLTALARSDLAAIPHDDERLRFVTGFADIFVTIGLGMFLGATMWFALHALPPAIAMAVVAVSNWLLAEVFTRSRRMALPSIALLAGFLASAGLAIFAAVASRPGTLSTSSIAATFDEPVAASVAGLGAAALAVMHYWRFRVPVTIAAGVAALIVAALMAIRTILPDAMAAYGSGLVALFGLAAFALALRFDLSDRHRTTRASDIAFWLHLLAAPLIVHPLLGLMGARDPSPGVSVLVLAVVLLLAAVALLIDRRALLVSGLAYAGLALGRLVRNSGVGGQSVPLSLLLLGAFVLALSAGWHSLRRALLSRLPAPAVARLPLPMDLR